MGVKFTIDLLTGRLVLVNIVAVAVVARLAMNGDYRVDMAGNYRIDMSQ